MHSTTSADMHQQATLRSWQIWLAAALLGLTLATIAGIAWMYLSTCRLFLDYDAYIGVVTGPAFAGLGFAIVRAQPANRIGWLCLVGGMSFILASGLSSYVNCTSSAATIITLVAALLTATILPAALVTSLFVLIPLWFPNGHNLNPRWRRFTNRILGVILGATLALMVGHDFRSDISLGYTFALDNPLGLSWLPGWWTVLFMQVQLGAVLVGCIAGIISIVLRLRRAQGEERQQVKWLCYFFASAIGLLLIGFELPGVFWYPELFDSPWYSFMLMIVFLSYPLVIGITIFHYRLYDIDTIINRTLVYVTLTLILGATYLASVITLQALFVRITGQASTLAIAASTLAIAALFQPLRGWLQTAIDRRFFRRKYDAQQVLAQFARTARDEVALEALTAELVHVVEETIQPERVTLWLQRGRADGRSREK
ncbi:MAG TPA: hypothetical protein PKA05_09090 [Roseiflexaceae bacterium]|nr:hypothetical protein [Roseiflexaceae bacterium]HMP40522.1 hypothetical protein [Roseiflexaceae bacterium]